MAVLAALLWGLLALLVLVLGVPFHARAVGSVHGESFGGAAEVRWGLGLLSLRVARGERARVAILGIRVLRLGARGKRREEAAEEDEAPDRPGRPRRRLRALLAHRGPLRRSAGRLAAVLQLSVCARGRVGTGDPADTAALAGAARLAEQIPGVRLELRWDWLEEELDVEVEGRARIWLAHLLVAALGLLLRREIRAMVRAVA
jgi:hypothetical protein